MPTQDAPDFAQPLSGVGQQQQVTVSTSVQGTTGVQHNDVTVGAEGTIDLEDGDVLWTVTDDTANGRVKVTPTIGSSKVTSAMIVDATIATGDLADGAVTSAKILDATIATGDLADGAVTSAKIADGTIATADIAALAVTTALIAAAAVTPAKMSVKLDSGSHTFTGGAADQAVSFTTAFSVAPVVTTKAQDSATGTDDGQVKSVTASGFTLHNSSGGTQAIGWIAVGT